jgi:type IV pilus assembly protein PilN
VNSTASREINKIDNRLADIDKQRRDAEAMLAQPQNSGTRDTAQYLNDAFKLKSFSWTQVLSDLEKLVPNGVQVVSIKPVLVDGQVQVAMEVSSTERTRALEMVRRMEASPRFPEVQITTERTTEQGTLNAAIQALYAPVRNP